MGANSYCRNENINMKTLPTNYQNSLTQRVQTLTICWRLVLTNGQVMGFTSFNRDITFTDDPGVTYKAATGFSPTAVQTSTDMTVDNLEVTGILSSSAITESDLNSGKYDYASVQVLRLNWMDKPYALSKCEILRTGILGQTTINDNQYQAEVRGLLQYYQFKVGDLYQPACRATLGDSQCTVDLTAFTFSSSVLTVSDNQVITSNLTNPDNFFANGNITFTSGLNAGLTMEVKYNQQANGTVTLELPMNYTVNVGDTFDIVKGCDHSIEVCVTFNNAVNFRGEPYLPGLDFLQSGADLQ